MFGKIKNLFYFGFVLIFLISCSEERCIEKNDFGDYDTIKFPVSSIGTSCDNVWSDSCEFDSYEPSWYPNVDGVTFKKNGAFSVRASGVLTLTDSNEKSLGFSAIKNVMQYTPSGQDKIFSLDSAVPVKLEYEGCNIIDRNTRHINSFLRRGVLFLNPLPSGGYLNYNKEYVGPELRPDFSTWKCQDNNTSGNINSIANYDCTADYSQISSNDYLNKNKELYGMEDTFEKTLGGSVVPTYNVSASGIDPFPLINYITPEVPFSGISCTLEDNEVVCRKNDTLVNVVSGDLLDDTSITTVLKNDFLLSSEGLKKKFLYPSAVAFKVVGGTSSNNKCTININNDKAEIPADGKWHLAKSINGSKKIVLNRNNHNALLSNNKKVNIDNSKFYDVSIVFNPNETWEDKDGNTIKCGDGVVAFFMPQNEILVNKSGFVSFKNLLSKNDSSNICQQSYSCVNNSYNIYLSVINPMYGDWNEDIISDNFYENIGRGGNFQPNVETFNINFANGNWSSEIFVRKGQILRFDETSWFDIDESNGTIKNKVFLMENGYYKNVSHGLVLKIEERPALFCSPNEGVQEPVIGGYIDGNPAESTLNIVQCYDLENYKGAFRNLFEGEKKGTETSDVIQYGELSVNDYNLGARKLNNVFANGTYGNLSNLVYYNNPSFRQPYTSELMLPVSSAKYLSFLTINNTNLNANSIRNSTNVFADKSNSCNGLKYKLFFSATDYYSNGQQLAVVLAEADWDGNENSDKIVKKFMNYDNNGNFDENISGYYHFNSEGVMVSNDNEDDSIIKLSDFPNVDFDNKDYRLFFKIIDKSETCDDGTKGVQQTRPLCICGSNSRTIKACEEIQCGEDIKFAFDTDGNNKYEDKCANNTYINNQGTYNVRIEASSGEDGSKGEGLLTKTGNETIKNFIDPILNLVDGTNVLLQTDSDGNPIQCGDSDGENDCRVFYKYKDRSLYNLNVGDKCTKTRNGSLAEFICFKKCVKSSDISCKVFNDGSGFLENFYKSVINDRSYKIIVKTCFALMFSFYGLYFLLGMAEFTQEDLIKKAIKISFVYLMIGTDGWEFYNRFFVRFFKEGIDYLTFSIAAAFSDDDAINDAVMQNKLYDKTILFDSINSSLRLLISDKLTARVWGVFFSSLAGPIYLILIFCAIMLFLVSILTALLLYVTAQFFISFLLAFGPIFFALLVFEKTKGMFDKWIGNLISFSLEQIFLITCISLFNSLAYNIIKSTFNYRVCIKPLLTFTLFGSKEIKLFTFWRISENDIPGLFQVLLIFLLAYLMKQFVQFMADLGAKLGGGDLNSSGITKDISNTISSTAGSVKDLAKKSTKKLGVTVGRKLGYETKEGREKIDQTNRTLRAGRDKAFDTAEQKTAEQMSALTSGKLPKGKSWRDALKDEDTYVKDVYEQTLKRNFDVAVEGDGDLSKALKERKMNSSELFDSSYFNLQQTSTLGGLLTNAISSGMRPTFRDRTLSGSISKVTGENATKPDQEENGVELNSDLLDDD